MAFMRSADFKLTSNASYSASLLDAGKPRLTAYSIVRPSSEMMTMPNPALCLLDTPSMKMEGSDDVLGSEALLMPSSSVCCLCAPLLLPPICLLSGTSLSPCLLLSSVSIRLDPLPNLLEPADLTSASAFQGFGSDEDWSPVFLVYNFFFNYDRPRLSSAITSGIPL
ncbi:hypothetical protein CsSME_00047055 [Camellia sinensis var. sinensis]